MLKILYIYAIIWIQKKENENKSSLTVLLKNTAILKSL